VGAGGLHIISEPPEAGKTLDQQPGPLWKEAASQRTKEEQWDISPYSTFFDCVE